jgi:hypothetical protein
VERDEGEGWRIDDDAARECPARRARANRDDGTDGGDGSAGTRHPRTDRCGGEPDRSAAAPQGRQPQDHQHHRGAGDGR